MLAEADDDLLLDVALVRGDDLAEGRVALVAERLVEARAARAADRTSRTCLRESFAVLATSSSVGGRSSLSVSSRSARAIFCSRSTMWTGMRIVRDLLATPRCTACRIHQVA